MMRVNININKYQFTLNEDSDWRTFYFFYQRCTQYGAR